MDLLKTLLIYMTMLFAASVQSAPDAQTILQQIATPAPVAAETRAPTPAPTAKPTPVPTVAISPNPAHKTLRVGDSGDLVRNLQNTLAEYGYYTGEIDGRYGNQTRRAVEQFQYNHGLQADGIAGRNTLTVLYDSNQVRFAAPTPSPTPAPGTLSIALTQPPTETPVPGPTHTPRPVTVLPAAEQTAGPAVAQTAEPAAQNAGPVAALATASGPAASPQATDAPSAAGATTAPATTASVFTAMEGWSIVIEGQGKPISFTGDTAEETMVVAPYALGDVVYVPLISILQANNVYVILSDNIELTEYAFALGSDLYRITYTETQDGEPADLNVYKNNQPQLLPLRDVRLGGNFVCVPAESVTSLTGITFVRDDGAKVLTVRFPA